MLENEKINSSENFQLQERSSESASHLVMSYSLWPYSWYWNAKEGSQELPGVTGKFGNGVKNEASQTLIKFCQENALVIANALFQQHKRRLYTWTSPDGQQQNQTDYILCSQIWRSSIQSAKTRPGADCGSDHELLIAKFRLKLKKVGKTTRPFRYDVSQIPNECRIIQWKWEIDLRD